MLFTKEQIEQDLAAFRQQKEFFMQQFHQVTGSISILEQMLAKLLEPEIESQEECDQNDAQEAQAEHE